MIQRFGQDMASGGLECLNALHGGFKFGCELRVDYDGAIFVEEIDDLECEGGRFDSDILDVVSSVQNPNDLRSSSFGPNVLVLHLLEEAARVVSGWRLGEFLRGL